MNKGTDAQEGDLKDLPKAGERSMTKTRSPDSNDGHCPSTQPNQTVSGW